jgi:hypothetical protein
MKTKSRWTSKTKTPRRKGWYVTRTADGDVLWRAWGCGAWWRQIKGGWIESFTGDGEAMTYEWDKDTRQSVDLDHDQLPAIIL